MKNNKKTNFKKSCFLVIAVLSLGAIAGCTTGETLEKEETTTEGNVTNANENDKQENKAAEQPKTDKSATEAPTQEPEEDLSKVEKVYELSAGIYTAGIDLPIGTCDIEAVSGTGNISSSNMYTGGVNEMFGVDDGTGWYTSSFKGMKMDKNVEFSVSGNVKVRLTYTKIEGNMTGRTYDESNSIELSSGNYTAGTDFKEGVYTIQALSGTGNLSSSNMFSGGVNEVFGIDSGTGIYTPEVKNIVLDKDVTLEVKGGLTVKLIPAVNK